jgi:hypothetical protein
MQGADVAFVPGLFGVRLRRFPIFRRGPPFTPPGISAGENTKARFSPHSKFGPLYSQPQSGLV